MKPIVLTKRQIEDTFDKLFDIEGVRRVLSQPVYDYAWTVWASRHNIRKLQGERAARQAKRERIIKP